MAVRDAATGVELGRVPCSGGQEALEAVDAASSALGDWSARSTTDRATVLGSIAHALRARKDEFAAIITAENGKPLDESHGEIDYSADYFLSAAQEAIRLAEESIPSRNPARSLAAIPEPIGVVAAITPWNFPLAMLARKTAPALAVGCTQVVKPAEQTPLTAILFAEVLMDAGLPSGAFNLVTGDASAISRAWLSDGRVRKLSFTGSTRVGRLLMHAAADQIVRLSLELGGHAPFIVFRDADIPAAVAAAIAGKFRVAGQTCVCPNRFLVAAEVYEQFVTRFVAAARALPIGKGCEPTTRIGPLISDTAVARVRAQVDDALAKGAKLLAGGATVPVTGCLDRFFAPTVLADASPEMLCFQEETFGPLAPIAKFGDEAEAIRIANATPYGLAAYAFSSDAARLDRVSRQLHCGIVGANTGVISDAFAPFGGCGWSGFGREGGRWGLYEYLSWKYVCTATRVS